MAEAFLKSTLKLTPESSFQAASDILFENIRRSLSLSARDELTNIIPICPEGRIQFLSKYYSWIPVDEDVLRSKIFQAS